MQEIVKINNETMTVSARDLHEKLKISTPYTIWFQRICEYGFVEGVDFVTKMLESSGGRPAQEADISIDMAKQICMIQRTEIGKVIRQYFIDLEKAWNTPEQIMARALKLADKTIADLKIQNKQLLADNEIMKPKAEFYDTVTDSKTALTMAKVSKILDFKGYGRNNLFKFLREKGIIRPGKRIEPYQKYIDNGWFRVVENEHPTYNNGSFVTTQTLVF